MSGQLSEHFSYRELTRSDIALRNGIENAPTEIHLKNLILLCEQVLEPVRAHFGPVRINSGYRSLAVNMLINPTTSMSTRLSRHCTGQAADFEVDGVPNIQVAEWCQDHLPEYHQVILEFYTPGQPNSGWVHVSFVEDFQKKECLTALRVGGKTVYHQGLVA